MKQVNLKKIFTSKFCIPISLFILGFSFLAFFINCSMDSMNTTDRDLSSSSENKITDSVGNILGPSTQSQEQINKNCRYEFNNGCYSGTLNDIPDVNRTLKWQCIGSFGTAHCAKANPHRVCGFDEKVVTA